MDDILPNIYIVLKDVDAYKFLERLEHIARQSGNFKTVNKDREGREAVILELLPAKEGKQSDPRGKAIYRPEYKPKIMFRMAALCWVPDPVTYEVYVAEVLALFRPLIQAYNKNYGSRLRLYMQPKASLEPKLPPTVQKAFDTFVSQANKAVLHWLDWDRFMISCASVTAEVSKALAIH